MELAHAARSYRYLLDIGGNSGTTWTALAWKLASGALVFKVKSVRRFHIAVQPSPSFLATHGAHSRGGPAETRDVLCCCSCVSLRPSPSRSSPALHGAQAEGAVDLWHDQIEPGVHLIEVSADFSDLAAQARRPHVTQGAFFAEPPATWTPCPYHRV